MSDYPYILGCDTFDPAGVRMLLNWILNRLQEVGKLEDEQVKAIVEEARKESIEAIRRR